MTPFVIFCVPTYSFGNCLEFTGSVARATALLMERRIPHAFLFRGGICFVDVARNLCCDSFLKEWPDATHLFFLDDDIGFEPEAVIDFIHRPEDIVCGIYPKKSDEVEYPVIIKVDETTQRFIQRGDLFQAVNIPGGFCCIRRHVIQKLASQAETYRFFDKNVGMRELPNIFEVGIRKNYEVLRKALDDVLSSDASDKSMSRARELLAAPAYDGQYWGEDSVFSQKAIAAGFDIWVKPQVNFSHRGSKKWEGNFSVTLNAFIEKAKADQAAAMRQVQEIPA